MCDWTNLEEIMQDLSLAQGHLVPARLETVAGAGPPPIHVQDEDSVERSYYESFCGGTGDFVTPDCEQIQMMLNLVKNVEEDDDPVNSSELNPITSEFIPTHLKKKINKNVALSSIKMAKDAELAARRPVPKDVIPTMFKKKSLPSTEVKNENISLSLASQRSSQILSPERKTVYTPSAGATVHYTKYLEKSMLKEEIAEDIWIKAEKQMQEIEARQRLKAERTSEERGNTSPLDIACGPVDVMLADHRHLLPGDCMVCIVAAKHGFYF